MVSPLGPTFANILGLFRKSVYGSARCIYASTLLQICRYVFCVFNSFEYVKMFLSFLNSIHPNLKLTCEIGPQKLTFLDTQI